MIGPRMRDRAESPSKAPIAVKDARSCIHTGHPVATKIRRSLHDFLPLIVVALLCFYVVGWDIKL